MDDNQPCGRPTYEAPPEADLQPVCLMHSRDPNKPVAEFQREVDRILSGTFSDHAGEDFFDFRGHVFPISVFKGEAFKGRADFTNATFTQIADFSGATFARGADFSKATFKENADFAEATFTGAARFNDVTFDQDANFGMATFTQKAMFVGTKFNKNANFVGAKFTAVAGFAHVTFNEGVGFMNAKFLQEAHFIGATFAKTADFTGVTFNENAYFISASFDQTATFDMATFILGAVFSETMFAHIGSFRAAKFTQAADFRSARFYQYADFRWATFSQKALFGPGPFGAIVDFRSASFERPSQVLFHRVNEPPAEGMRARFINCLLEGVRFEDVHWHTKGDRLILQDEIDLRAKEEGATHELVSDAYRRLVNNFEKARQYELAEQCVIAEMEMRRLNPRNFIFAQYKWVAALYEKSAVARWFGEHFSIANFYRELSNYGSSYKRALGLLVLLLLAFALFFPIFGLRPAKDSDLTPQCSSVVPWSSEAKVISWGCAAAHPNRFREHWGTLKAGLWASFETATFQRLRVVEPATGWGRALAIVEIIVVPGQLALFLLALRRRFRR